MFESKALDEVKKLSNARDLYMIEIFTKKCYNKKAPERNPKFT